MRVDTRKQSEFAVFVVDQSFESKIARLTSSPTDFYLVLLPHDWPVFQIWGVRDALDKKRIAYDIVHLIRSSDAADVLAAVDCGLRNAKQSLGLQDWSHGCSHHG